MVSKVPLKILDGIFNEWCFHKNVDKIKKNDKVWKRGRNKNVKTRQIIKCGVIYLASFTIVYSLLLSVMKYRQLDHAVNVMKWQHTLIYGCNDILFLALLTRQNTVHYWTTFASKYRPTTDTGIYNSSRPIRKNICIFAFSISQITQFTRSCSAW